ncbi:helix-hairpin-helix domain-containing protein [Bacillaceae bacterium W0354]
MYDPITPFGRRWEIRHSFWLFWLLGPFGLTSFISFFYIGARAGRKKWLIAAFIYLIISFSSLYVAGDADEDSILLDIAAGLALTVWVGSGIHAFLARREYLRIIAKKIIDNPYRQTPPIKVQTRYPFFDDTKTAQPMSIKNVKKKKSHIPVADQEEPFMLRINKASLKEIASHPYIGNIVARQIVQVRDKVGQFNSYSHFVKETDIKPHILAKAKPYLIFNEKEEQHKQDEPKQPTVTPQKKEYRSGRIVDY